MTEPPPQPVSSSGRIADWVNACTLSTTPHQGSTEAFSTGSQAQ